MPAVGGPEWYAACVDDARADLRQEQDALAVARRRCRAAEVVLDVAIEQHAKRLAGRGREPARSVRWRSFGSDLQPGVGHSVDSCCRESVLVALVLGEPFAFAFNGVTLTALPGGSPDDVYRQWTGVRGE